MFSFIFTLLIGTVIGWVIPQPAVAKPVTDRLVELTKVGLTKLQAVLTSPKV